MINNFFQKTPFPPMKFLKDFNVKNKRVLVRCDFQIPLSEKGEILDDFKIKLTIPTIEYLKKKKAKIILMSHWQPEGKGEAQSLKPIFFRLKELLGQELKFLDDCLGEKVKKEIEKMKMGEVLLLENLRFYKEEKENNLDFAQKLAKLGDIYINEAFSVCHRAHASIVGIPKYLPSAMGFLLEKEIKNLNKILKNPFHPLVVIIGGKKIETKIKVIENFLERADHLLLGGKIANTILGVKGIFKDGFLTEGIEEKMFKKIESLDLTNPKLHLPLDVIVSLDETGLVYIRQAAPANFKKDEMILDIGPETINIFSKIIKQAKMILWNGPLGLFERKLFEKGTKEIAQAIVQNRSAFKVAGGGETVAALNKFGFFNNFDHVSTGGGAMLEFLAGEELPGIKALK